MVSVSKTPIFLAHRGGREAREAVWLWETSAAIFASFLVLLAIGEVLIQAPKHSNLFVQTMFAVPPSVEWGIVGIAVLCGFLAMHCGMKGVSAEQPINGKIREFEILLLGSDDKWRGTLRNMSLDDIKTKSRGILAHQLSEVRKTLTKPNGDRERKKLGDFYSLLWEFNLLEPQEFSRAIKEAELKAS